MEPDRYQQNHLLFIVGLCALLLSIGLFIFSFYLFPNLILHWRYHIPHFVIVYHHFLQTEYELSRLLAAWSIILGLLVCGLITAIIAYIASNRIDNAIYEPEETGKKPTQVSDVFSFSLRMVLIILMVFMSAQLLQWLITKHSEQPQKEEARVSI